ncbi:hypothetical protein C4J94_3911 [Pseudomonas sp. R5-89-07]|nr:hypothetical protein C4J94_3911 [Pseudomonas sp. R5-89-07]
MRLKNPSADVALQWHCPARLIILGNFATHQHLFILWFRVKTVS